MERNQKIAEFIRREVLSFVIGVLFATILSYGFRLGDWANVFNGQLIIPVLLVFILLMQFFSRRSAKQR